MAVLPTLQEINIQSQQLQQSDGNKTRFNFLLQFTEQFSEDAEYHYLLGLAALDAQLFDDAVLAFEKAVLIQPNFAGAWLDLSIAYYRAGKNDTAQQIIQHIEQNFSPPQHLQQEINKAKKVIQDSTFISQWRSEVSVLAGYIRNANYGINTSTLQLTLIDGDLITAQISPEFRPKSDHAYESRFATGRRFQHESGAFSDIQIAARAREYHSIDAQSFVDVAGSWFYLHPLNKQSGSYGLFSTSYRHFMLDGQNLGGFTTLSAGLKQYYGKCAASLRHEHEMRNFHADGLFDATVPWLAIGAECAWNQWSAQIDYRVGWDKPQGERVGGTTRRDEFSAIVRWDIQDNLFARGILYLADYQDQQGYSPLIKSGAERYIHRVGQRLEVSWRLPESISNHWYALLEIDNVNTTSNIPLSRYDDTQVFTGLRYQF